MDSVIGRLTFSILFSRALDHVQAVIDVKRFGKLIFNIIFALRLAFEDFLNDSLLLHQMSILTTFLCQWILCVEIFNVMFNVNFFVRQKKRKNSFRRNVCGWIFCHELFWRSKNDSMKLDFVEEIILWALVTVCLWIFKWKY